jgi:SagB-type dehydrogenase family enzyme
MDAAAVAVAVSLDRLLDDNFIIELIGLVMSSFDFTRKLGFSSPMLYEVYHANSRLSAKPGLSSLNVEEMRITARAGFGSKGLPIYKKSTALVETNFDQILDGRRSCREFAGALNSSQMWALIYAACGVTGFLQDDENGITYVLHTSPSSGGLNGLDVYVAVQDVDDINPGVYFFNQIDEALELISADSVEELMKNGFYGQQFSLSSPLAFLLVASFGRTAAKYGERAYRLAFLDAGHMAQNILLKAVDMSLAAVPIAGFYDDALSIHLRIDGRTEAVIHSVFVGRPA